MSVRISWSLAVEVASGPKFSTTQAVSVDAYDKVEVTLAAGSDAEKVTLQPAAAEQVQFLLLASDQYGADLSYSLNAAEADKTKRIKLDAPQILVGSGAVGLLAAAPQSAFFYNGLAKAVAISILVGRNATS